MIFTVHAGKEQSVQLDTFQKNEAKQQEFDNNSSVKRIPTHRATVQAIYMKSLCLKLGIMFWKISDYTLILLK